MNVIDISDTKFSFTPVWKEIALANGASNSKYMLMQQGNSIFNEDNFREVANAMAIGFGKKAVIVCKPGQELPCDIAVGASRTCNWWFAFFA